MDTKHFAKIDSYEILSVIRQGDMSSLYLARNPMLERQVAIKILDQGDEPQGADAFTRKLFLNEARIAAALKHPNIVAVHDAGVFENCPYIVMEYIYNGRSLQRYCRSVDEMLPVDEVIKLVMSCAQALHAAHQEGIIHRDVKPRNILLDEKFEPKLSDFGLAVASRSDATMTHLAGAGSPLYMSPEQVLEENITPASDIFSLGVTLYELLTLENPFKGRALNDVLTNIVGTAHRPIRQIRGDLPRELHQVVNRALAKTPEKRYSSAFDMAADLALVLDKVTESASAVRKRQDLAEAKALAFFAAFPERELKEVVDSAQLERYRPGETIVLEGDESSSFYVLVDGGVEIRKGEFELSALGAGDCFGEIGALTGESRTASVVAREASTVMAIPARLLQGSTPGCQLRIKDRFLGLLAQRLSQTLDLVC